LKEGKFPAHTIIPVLNHYADTAQNQDMSSGAFYAQQSQTNSNSTFANENMEEMEGRVDVFGDDEDRRPRSPSGSERGTVGTSFADRIENIVQKES
jgi:hypothetical protein